MLISSCYFRLTFSSCQAEPASKTQVHGNHNWEGKLINAQWANGEWFLGEVKVVQLCPTLCNQVRILEWVAIPFSRGSSQPREWTQVSHIAGRFFTGLTSRETQKKVFPNWELNPGHSGESAES